MDKIASQVAANIYGNTAKIGGAGGGMSGASPAKVEGGSSFEDILKSTAENVVDTMKSGEKVSAEAVVGNADLNDVVQAVTSAEITLQTVVAVRDRLVGALQEVLRMSI